MQFEALEKDFEKVGELVTKKLAPHEQTKNHLVALKPILRGATINMSTEDTKDLNNFLSVISNAKLQADRDKDKQKKNVSKKKDKFANAAAKARDNDDGAYDAFMVSGRAGHARVSTHSTGRIFSIWRPRAREERAHSRVHVLRHTARTRAKPHAALDGAGASASNPRCRNRRLTSAMPRLRFSHVPCARSKREEAAPLPLLTRLRRW